MLGDRLGRVARSFILQWHLTHACEMSCAHCYDRSRIETLRLPDPKRIADDLIGFCARRGVAPGVSLSGGNPVLYPRFLELYRYLAERGVALSILGNPISREMLGQIVAIRKPRYYQVSLEGLQEHNDSVRGAGSYQRAMEFLPLLREHGVPSCVMLTLTSDNIRQVIPLARLLHGKTDRFAWNRLTQFGNGAALSLPTTEAFGRLMASWMGEQRKDPMLGIKDNLFNIFRHELGLKLVGGCTGHGCGAAFNFFAVLPNGDAHACRKFPSRIGSLLESGLDVLYDSPEAERYRRGCTDCDGCPIRHRCGGCLAVASGSGLDPFTERDPQCFT
jgi:selenobiotic family peptide radical SAM maturase